MNTLKIIIKKSLMPILNKLPLKLLDKLAIDPLQNFSNWSIANNTGKRYHISLSFKQVRWIACLARG
jgi:hypothetical protein